VFAADVRGALCDVGASSAFDRRLNCWGRLEGDLAMALLAAFWHKRGMRGV
jgi:hypothetical protein